ncbi:MAG: ABC transporter permease [Desulfobaccales bacterium]
MFKLTWRNTIRHPLRASLTVAGMALTVLAFCLLRTMVADWFAGVANVSPCRLVTRSAISLIYRLPISYLSKIQAVQGVKNMAYGSWLEGLYRDEKNFFPQMSVSMPSSFEIYPEYQIPEDQKSALFQDRRGAAAGRQLAARYGWRVGDPIILKGTIFPGEYFFILRAIYTGRDSTTDENRFYFHWEYLNEALKKSLPERADQTSWFIIEVARPELAAAVAGEIDAMFKNSPAETITETESAFIQGYTSMTEALLQVIEVSSWVVIGVILMVLANSMAMSARETMGEYAMLKVMGFRPRHLAGLILGESLLLSLMGGLLGLGLTFPAVHFFQTQLGDYFRVFPLTRLTLGLGLGVALAVGVLAALLPAWRASRVGIAAALRKVG